MTDGQKDSAMLATDVIHYLAGQLDLVGMNLSPEGEQEYQFARPFDFVLTEVDAATVALFAPLDMPDGIEREALLRRLLEANLQGVETGAGALCLDAFGRLGYRDVLHLGGMTLEAVQLRFVDFVLYYEFWRGQGLGSVAEELRQTGLPGEGFIKL